MFTVSCATTTEPAPAPTATQPAVDPGGAPEPEETPAPEETAPAPEPVTATCDELITPDLVAELEGQDWTFKEEPLTIGDVAPADGIHCTWGDFSVATGNVLILAWAPLTAEESETAQAELESTGWIREDGDGTVYYTEDPAQALTTDDDGYGMTYQFGDDWVTLSDTKQGLLLIERPGA